jgi:hypothetical protein
MLTTSFLPKLTFLADSSLEKDTHDRLGVHTERNLGLNQRSLEEIGFSLLPLDSELFFSLLVSIGLFFGDLQYNQTLQAIVSGWQWSASRHPAVTNLLLALSARRRLLADRIQELLRLPSLFVLHPERLYRAGE